MLLTWLGGSCFLPQKWLVLSTVFNLTWKGHLPSDFQSRKDCSSEVWKPSTRLKHHVSSFLRCWNRSLSLHDAEQMWYFSILFPYSWPLKDSNLESASTMLSHIVWLIQSGEGFGAWPLLSKTCPPKRKNENSVSLRSLEYFRTCQFFYGVQSYKQTSNLKHTFSHHITPMRSTTPP